MSDQHRPARIDYARQSPALFQKFLDFSLAVAADGDIDAGISHLVDIRASQLNGCAFCLDMHVKQARMHGERELRLHHVAIWRESPLFTLPERAALAWTEALTQLAPTGVDDALFDTVREQFDARALTALTYRIMAINGWNRINVAFRSVPGTLDKRYGLDAAGLS
ncbi:carboxymuconolactone decarboxylase family protein [Nitrogeniibacter mangrovi]|uniref:Carboxymuconolactone decarboxylase family protein n=1 Tax=Nitrogeniibacter mangrovi TaxID=2016596 RepID=A0A6C1B015_9RHOO|nr:carboxymuconolactone decarboxylase family protein [Nitrogeniibacter mangrovi]QID16329.1 carboxymuconolactone decarboxylase family protein [Nitrogeniibacter mangrovi]